MIYFYNLRTSLNTKLVISLCTWRKESIALAAQCCQEATKSYKKTETKSGTLVMALLLTSCPLNTSLESLRSLPPPLRSQLLWYSPPPS